ncbi:MAG: hypothetical protein OEW45_18750, partial [Deltaproteobacteria bacterium]|nr:hypothetical protein [Deltaproteobacteria bacterium]
AKFIGETSTSSFYCNYQGIDFFKENRFVSPLGPASENWGLRDPENRPDRIFSPATIPGNSSNIILEQNIYI